MRNIFQFIKGIIDKSHISLKTLSPFKSRKNVEPISKIQNISPIGGTG